MKSQRGFTILEVVVAVAVVGILVAIFLGTHRTGFFRGYEISAEARSLNSALNLARMRATQKRLALSITDSSCSGTAVVDQSGTTWYPTVQFKGTSSVPLGYQVGDYVVFSNLDLLSLNGGAFPIKSIEKLDDDTSTAPDFVTWFTCSATVGIKGTSPNSTYGPTAVPLSRAYAYSQNVSRASVVIIRRKSLRAKELLEQTDSAKRAQMEVNFDRQEYYWYKDNVIVAPGTPASSVAPEVELMEGIDVSNRIPATATGTNINDKIFIGFNSRGLPTMQDGYQIRLQNKKDTKPHVRWVTIGPTGRANLAAGKDPNATFPP